MTTKKYDEIADLIERRAPAITMTELSGRVRSPAGEVALPPRPARARVGLAVVATAVVAVVAAGAITAVRLGSQHQLEPVPVTAAMVRRIARASEIALAAEGHALVSYSEVVGTTPDGSGTLDITFSGQNFNIVSRQPGAKPFTERVVDSQIYTFGDPPPGQPLQWYHSTTESQARGVAVPDPRKLLSALSPTAGFAVIGKEVIDGVPLTHLRATNVKGMNARLLSLNTTDQPISGLDIWVDSSGVVRIIQERCQGQPSRLTRSRSSRSPSGSPASESRSRLPRRLTTGLR